jgi:hypothetical protein
MYAIGGILGCGLAKNIQINRSNVFVEYKVTFLLCENVLLSYDLVETTLLIIVDRHWKFLYEARS